MLEVGAKLGPFLIDKELGSGAMGAVYRGKHEETGQKVAIKVMLPVVASNESIQQRFKRESEILKQLKHPNITRLVATGRYKKMHFFAMEYVKGESLDKVLLRRTRLTWEEVVVFGKQLCAALKCAHEHAIVHRDIKPSNIMVLRDDTIKLTDFGIAKDMDASGLTATNATVGTASYMSPEQCKGEKTITASSDLYSMGVMFYELLTGEKPFLAESAMEMFMQHLHREFERPSRIILDIPIWLDNLVVQLLEKEPQHRPHSAAAVEESLEQVQQKVETLQSAGMELATHGTAHRGSTQPELDDEDREAARTMLRKKKKRKKRTPIQGTWIFQALAMAVLFSIIGFLVYQVFLRQPTLEELQTETETLMRQEEYASVLDGPIAQFEELFRDSKDDTAKLMRIFKEKAEFLLTQRQVHARRHRNLEPDTKEERMIRLALTYEEQGKLEDATRLWQTVAQKKDNRDSNLHRYGVFAVRYHRDIEEAHARIKELSKEIEEKEPEDIDKKSGPEKIALKALLAEKNKDTKKAITLWNELQELNDNRKGSELERLWYLVAASKKYELEKGE